MSSSPNNNSEGPVQVLTDTDHAGVLVVSAVVDAPAQAVAALQPGLAATAVDVVQQDLAAAVPEVGVLVRREGRAAAHLAAHHLGVGQVPVVVTHGAPAAPVVHLHAALAGVATPHKPDGAVTCGQGGGGVGILGSRNISIHMGC